MALDFVSNHGTLRYDDRPFESGCFDNRSFEVYDWESDDFAALFGDFRDSLELSPGDFLWTRIPAHSIEAVSQATSAGFYFVEGTIIPFLKMRNWSRDDFSRYILPMKAADDTTIAQIEDIAKTTFTGLRFNLDPNIPETAADERYLRWLRNAYADGQDIVYITHHDRIAGFSLLRHLDEGKTIFVLAGLHPDFKNSGLGLTLYASTTAHCQDKQAKTVDGGISMANTPVLNVMSHLGYSFKDPTVVLHYRVS